METEDKGRAVEAVEKEIENIARLRFSPNRLWRLPVGLGIKGDGRGENQA
jgi:hypothetical protein